MPNPPIDVFDHGVTYELVSEISVHIGMLVLNWAFIEQAMSGVFEATETLALEAGIRVRRPWGFRDKRTQFKRLFDQIQPLQQYRPRTDLMIQGLDNLTPFRDCVVHGSISEFDKITGMLTFVKVNPDRAAAYHQMTEFRISRDSLAPAADSTLRLAKDMQRLTIELIDLYIPENLDNNTRRT